MTVAILSAGDGYAYYTDSISRGDGAGRGQELGDYYLEAGTPPGVWVGSGIGDLGVTGVVREDQMRALFGDGLHPEADAMLERLIGEGMAPGKAVEAVRLGRKFATYKDRSSVLADRIDRALKAEAHRLGRALVAVEERHVRMREAGILYRERHGHGGSPAEVGRLLKTELGKTSKAVAGFDLTFSAPKSVSVAWALGDGDVAAAMVGAHERAITTTVAFLEREVIRSRTGTRGVAQHVTDGIVGTRFRHWESRDGDPQLHDHLVISNRVRVTDAGGRERWLTIDSRALHVGTMAASAEYNRALADELKQLGFGLRERAGSGAYRGVELACVSDGMIDRFSSRSSKIEARTVELVAGYVAEHGREPGRRAMLELRQQATLETRQGKSEPETLSGLRARWAAQAGEVAGEVTARASAELQAGAATDEIAVDVPAIAAQLADQIGWRQSSWGRHHIETMVNVWAAARPHVVPQAVRDRIVDVVLGEGSVRITPIVDVPAHAEITNPDGTSVYDSPRAWLYTSRAVLAAEDLLLDTARRLDVPAVSDRVFGAVLAGFDGPVLDQGQMDLAAQIATGEHVLTVGIGPAGAGKTTAVKVAGEAIRRAGRRVYGLATSAAAAHQLQEASGVRSETIAKFVWDATEGRGWPIGPGDVVVVDEAGMVGTRELARVVEMVTRAGGFVRLLGDDRQLQAIGTGGVLRQIDVEVGAVRLEVLHRFEDAGEGAATLRLRGDGDVGWWLENGRVHGGMGADVYGRVVDEWAANVRAGRSVLMMAGSNEQVAVLNGLAQEMLLADGRVDHGRVVELRDATTAGVGDRIVSRKNHRGLRYGRGSYVKNGDLWTVAGFRDDGVLVRNSGGQQVMLPTDYVADAVELGYASTLHRAQGATVDRALVLVDESMSREGLYVGLTRGRASNEAFVVTDGRSAAEVLRLVAGRSGAAVSARGMIEQAEREVGSPAHLVRILRDMQGRADGHRFERIVWDVMPDLAGVVLGSDRRDRLFTALARAEDAGFAADRVLRLVGQDLPVNVGDPTGLLGWRITKHLARAEQHRLDAPARPLAYLSEAQLEGMLDTAGAARRDALAVLWATRRDGQAPKDWGIGAGRCRELTVAAGEFYRAQYEGSPAQTYIRERLGTDLIGSPYQVGYAPAGWMSLVTYLRETCGATDSEIVAAGLGRMSSRGTLIDLFRDRVMFGITDHDGDLVGFVGRAGPAADKSVPKYVNSPETPIFRKSEVLFGLSEGASVLDAGGVPVRVEGPLDAIAISLAGEGRAVGVAPLGTALTREQGELLAASGPVVWSGVDADEAGRKAAGRDLALYADLGLDARELVLPVCPDGRVVKDPAELWQVDPDGLRAALGLGESAPLLAGRIVLGCLDDEAIMVHAAARVGAARDIGRIVAGLPAGQADEVVELAAGVLADRAGQPGAVDEFRAMIEAAAKDASTVVFEGRPFGWDSGVVLADRLHDVRARIGMIGGAIEETRRYAREGLGERLAGRVSRLVEERNYLLRTEVGLRAETRLRAGQDRVVSRREEEARRWQQGPSVGGPEGAVEQHATLEKALWLEAQYRTLDRDLSINDKPGNVPSWAVPGRGVQDVRQSASWAPVLGEMGGRVAAAMRKRGQELAVDADRPRWCETYLGAVPEVGSGLRERWELLAARIDTWRGLTGHSDPVRALPAPSRSRDASLDGVRDLHVLHADAADLRRDIINELVGDRSTSGVWVETPSGAVPEAGPIVRRAGLDIEPPPVVEGERVDYRAVDRARERRFAEQRLEVLGAAGGGVDVLRAVAVERAGLREPVVAGRVRERGLER